MSVLLKTSVMFLTHMGRDSTLKVSQDLDFTGFVRASGNLGRPAEGNVFNCFQERLRGAIVHELKKKNLWNTPPRFLGICGVDSWAKEEALTELTQDCTLFILRRLPTLIEHAKVKPNVEGLVFRIIRNFLKDRQKQHDLLGFRVFKILSWFAQDAIERGRLHRQRGGLDFDAETLLSFRDTALQTLSPEIETLQIEAWTRAVLPDVLPLMMRIGSRNRELVRIRLDASLSELEHLGVSTFHFKTLVQVWQQLARHHWAAMLHGTRGLVFADGQELYATLTSIHHGFEQRQAFAALRSCVEHNIETLDAPLRKRRRLFAIWDAFLVIANEDQPIPSERALARLLNMPRRQVKRLREMLQKMVEHCRGKGT